MAALMLAAVVAAWIPLTSSFAASHFGLHQPRNPTAFSMFLAPSLHSNLAGTQGPQRASWGIRVVRMDSWDDGAQRGRGKHRLAVDPMPMTSKGSQGRFNVTWDVTQLVTHHSYSKLLLDITLSTSDIDDVAVSPAARTSTPRRGGDASRTASPRRGGRNEVESALRKELEAVLAEHAEINALSDELRDQGAQAGGLVHFKLRSLKKRKLAIKDRIQAIEATLAHVQQQAEAAADEAGGDEADEREGDGGVSLVIARLEEEGLRPDAVPEHKDAVFLALVKGLQQSGLRPLGYDFREETVMGLDRQFPHAAKRSKQHIIKVLGVQAHRLNGIGGWPLSQEEFARYFLRAWWTVEGATHDLFMAASHLYDVRIIVLNLVEGEEGGVELDEEVYEGMSGGPGEERATIWLCRTGSHVISTRPLKGTRSASTDARGASRHRSASVSAQWAERSRLASPSHEAEAASPQRGRSRERTASPSAERGAIVVGDLEEGLVGDSMFGEEEESMLGGEEELAGDDDDEGWRDGDIGRAMRGVYGGTATRRLFVTANLCEAGRKGIDRVRERARATFPLGGKSLDESVKWTDPDGCHITLGELEVPAAGGQASIENTVSAVSHTIMSLALEPFTLKASHLGCFWSAAGSGWGRLPRVLFAGLDDGSVSPLLRMHAALADETTLPIVTRVFHAHITLAKARLPGGGEEAGGKRRRVLRVLGKWAQDPGRSFELQKALGGDDKERGGGSAGGEGRGKKGKARWEAIHAGGGGRGRGDGTKDRKRKGRGERDLGGLNAEMAEEALAELAGDASQASSRQAGWGGAWGFDIRVNSFSIVEAVREEGEAPRYVTLRKVLL